MKSTITADKRPYRQGARAQAAEQTAQRIIEAFSKRLSQDWYDQITLETIAREAQVTVPTIIRRFGGKDGLLEATWGRMAERLQTGRAADVGNVTGAVRVIVAEYEVAGDLVMRALAQEERYPVFKPVNDMGRKDHRAWIEATFAPWLDGLAAPERLRRVDGLVAALDLYIWRLVRRDMGRPREHVEAVMLDLVRGVLGDDFLHPTHGGQR